MPAAQVRGPPAAVDRQAGRNLGDPKMVNARLHDHFEGEFHPYRIEFERQHRVAAKAAQPTVKIPAGAPVQCPANQSQERVAKKSVQWGHSARRYPTPETVAEHQVISVAKLLERRLQGREVVAGVGVTHYHDPAARGLDTRPQRIAVTLRGHGYDACAITGRNRLSCPCYCYRRRSPNPGHCTSRDMPVPFERRSPPSALR